MKLCEFEKLVRRVVAELPERFREKMGDLAVVVKEEPDRADLKLAGARKGELYGLCHATPLPEQTFYDMDVLPARILLYRKPLEEDFPDREELADEIRKTVLHEVGHYFGLSERELKKLGYE